MSSQSRSISILSWNVRGLGEPDKCKLVSATISSVRPVLIMLQETKLANIDALKARSFLPAFLDCYHFIGSYGSRGGVISAWDSSVLSKTSFVSRHHSLTISFSYNLSDISFTASNIYAPSDHSLSLISSSLN
jgi:exonuclease III